MKGRGFLCEQDDIRGSDDTICDIIKSKDREVVNAHKVNCTLTVDIDQTKTDNCHSRQHEKQ